MGTTTIGLIGLGLIGGSIAKAIRKFHPDYQIRAYNRTKEVLEDAVFDKIGILATREHRSITNYIEFILLKHISEIEAEEGEISVNNDT